MESARVSRQSQKLGRTLSFAAALISLALTALPAAAQPVRLVAFGDSLTAGYGLDTSQAFPAVLERGLTDKGLEVTIANAGVSGDTAAAGLARLDWSVPEGTQGVILALGANDALRGLPPEQARQSLSAILARLKERNIPVLLIGMYAPRNLGQAYYEAFDGMYPELASEYGVDLYPFFLDGVVGETKLNLQDGIHPNAEGVKIMVERILPTAETFVRSLAGGT